MKIARHDFVKSIMKNKLVVLSGLVLGFTPFVALAQTGATCGTAGQTGIGKLICKIQGLLELVVPVLVTVGIIYFVWGIVSYVIADDEEAKSSGRARMMWGIVGLAVIVSMWGLVRILTETAEVNNNTSNIRLPNTPSQ